MSGTSCVSGRVTSSRLVVVENLLNLVDDARHFEGFAFLKSFVLFERFED
jgi:hypothetical protein